MCSLFTHQEGLCHCDVAPDRRPQQRRLRRGVPGLQHAGLGQLLPRVLVAAGVGQVAGGGGRLPQEEQDELGVGAQTGVVEGSVALLFFSLVSALCSEKTGRGGLVGVRGQGRVWGAGEGEGWV